jgi:hypothetical protein
MRVRGRWVFDEPRSSDQLDRHLAVRFVLDLTGPAAWAAALPEPLVVIAIGLVWLDARAQPVEDAKEDDDTD